VRPRSSSSPTLRRVSLAALAVLFHVLLVRNVRADANEPQEEAAIRLLERAEEDDAAFRFASAVAGYDEALRTRPSMPKAMRAEARANVLRAHAEGDFAPFVALERVRRDPVLASDGAAVDELVRAAEGFPPGLVRIEVWALAAEAYASRLGRVDYAIRAWQRIADDPLADPVVSGSALKSIMTYELARGSYDRAAAVAAHPRADAKLVKDVRQAIRRRRIHLVATAFLGVAFAAVLVALGRAARARRLREVLVRARARPSSALLLGYAAYVAIGGALLASGYEEGTAQPFLLYGVALVPILFLARAWGAAGSPTPAARGVRAAVCATSALGAAFLVLERVDVTYLEGLGL
jgi:hypothetical protein